MAATDHFRIHNWEEVEPGMIVWARLFLPHQRKQEEEKLNKCENCIELIQEKHERPLKRRHKIISVRKCRPVLILEKLATHATIKYV